MEKSSADVQNAYASNFSVKIGKKFSINESSDWEI